MSACALWRLNRRGLGYILFAFHYTLIAYTLNPWSRFGGVLAVLVYFGWLLNDGFCLLSQLEHRLCGSTCLGARLKRVSRLERVVLVTSLCARVLLA